MGQLYCFIDGDIAFTRKCCLDGYTPCNGDGVAGTLVECDQGQRWNLRALTVSCNTSTSTSSSSTVISGQVKNPVGNVYSTGK